VHIKNWPCRGLPIAHERPERGLGPLPPCLSVTWTFGLHQHSIWFSRILRVLIKDAHFHSDLGPAQQSSLFQCHLTWPLGAWRGQLTLLSSMGPSSGMRLGRGTVSLTTCKASADSAATHQDVILTRH
jgi:hypothetical protein